MTKRTKTYVCVALIFFGATMFCFGTAYQKPVAPAITIVIALLGAVFSILSRIAYNKENRPGLKDNIR